MLDRRRIASLLSFLTAGLAVACTPRVEPGSGGKGGGSSTGTTSSTATTSSTGATCDLTQCPAPATCNEAMCKPDATCGTQPSAAHKACSTPSLPMGVCDGMSNCIGCVDASDCKMPGAICPSTHICTPGACLNMVKDGKETDVDCGGGDCPACANSKTCVTGTDCTSGYCSAGKCAPCTQQTCAPNQFCDPTVNGGSCVGTKADGATCTGGHDYQCKSAHCVEGVCCDTACGGGTGCDSCLAANNGATTGVCGHITSGTDPHMSCASGGQCKTKTCDGQGSCGNVAAGTACGNGPTCLSAYQQKVQDTCDALGNCATGAVSGCAQYYQCTGNACNTSCTTDAQCTTHCDTSVGSVNYQKCVQCVDNTSCFGGKPVCDNLNVCVECNANFQCNNSFAGPTCGPTAATAHSCGCNFSSNCTNAPGGAVCGPVPNYANVCGCNGSADCTTNNAGRTCGITAAHRCGCQAASQTTDCAGIGTGTCVGGRCQ